MSNTTKLPRRQERIFAFKVLYGLSFSTIETLEQLEAVFLASPDRPEAISTASGFSWNIVVGVWKEQDKLDKIISSFSDNWRIERMGKVELSLLRIAIFELLYAPNIPEKVILNEAIELSKQFGDDKSRGFVNGILDTAVSELESGKLQRSAH